VFWVRILVRSPEKRIRKSREGCFDEEASELLRYRKIITSKSHYHSPLSSMLYIPTKRCGKYD